MAASRIVCGMVLTACSGAGLACDLPPLAVLPPAETLAENAPAFQAQWLAYLEGMQRYVACTRDALAAAGGEYAPALAQAVLVKRNNDAVAEVERMRALYGERSALAARAAQGPPADRVPGPAPAPDPAAAFDVPTGQPTPAR